ncbi:MAG TPA: DMT family transporter [Candidatus Udaeobacter sp.]|nr:DMT family transporter [Candidatus Udaeobacter sp.]
MGESRIDAAQQTAGARSLSLRGLVLANLALLVMIAVWGAFFPMLERLLIHWDVYTATAGRQLLGTMVLFPCLFFERRRIPIPGLRSLGQLALMGGIGVALGSLLTSVGVALSSGFSSAIISTSNPVTSALAAALLFREPLGRGMVLGAVLAVAGGLISALGGESTTGAHFEGGEILIVIANVTWTWMSLAAQRWLKGYSQLQITTYTIAAGALWLLLLMPIVHRAGIVPFKFDFSLEALTIILFAGVFPIALGNFLWHYAVSRIGVLVPSMYSNLLPLAALPVVVLLGGRFAWIQLLGAAVIVVGVLSAQILAFRRRRSTA